MIYTANQTLLFPPLYMLDRFRRVSAIVLMRQAQFEKFGHQARLELVTKQGPKIFPVPLKDRSFKRLMDIKLHQPEIWLRKFKATLQSNYGKCDGYQELKVSLFDTLENVVSIPDVSLATLGEASIRWSMDVMGIHTPIVDAEDVVGDRPGDASEWVAAMGTAVGGTTYLGGGAAMKNYIKKEAFDRANIMLMEQDFKYAGHIDVNGDRCLNAWVSILDPLMVGGSVSTVKSIFHYSTSDMVPV